MDAQGDADLCGELKKVDGAAQLASDARARRCLPKMFPQASRQTAVPDGGPTAEDKQRFKKELPAAYKDTLRNCGAGPGGMFGEHWNWMPFQHPNSFENICRGC